MGLLPLGSLISSSVSIFLLLAVDLPCLTSIRPPSLKDASDFLVRGLDEVEPAFGLFEGEMYAGLLPMDNGHRKGEIMFWLFAPDQPVVPDSLTIWFNGGPGCSAFGPGVLVENGPATVELLPAGACCMAEKETLKYNKYAWTNTTAMLYIEQPVGTGFSTGPEPMNETEVAADMYAFLQNFYAVFSDYVSHQLYIFGESYAGMYVPSIARTIYLENEKLSRQAGRSRTSSRTGIDTIPIQLAGIALGNGWIDARVQGPAVIDYAYWHGMLDQSTRENLHAEHEHCMKNYDSTSRSSASDEGEPEPFHKFNVPDECGVMEATLQAAGAGIWSERMAGPNTYDVTTWDTYLILQNGGIDT
jgi:carboxypeptidase C (cathepsin A)